MNAVCLSVVHLASRDEELHVCTYVSHLHAGSGWRGAWGGIKWGVSAEPTSTLPAVYADLCMQHAQDDFLTRTRNTRRSDGGGDGGCSVHREHNMRMSV